MAMRAMLWDRAHAPLRCVEVAIPQPARGQVLLKVSACAVCRTDLHLLDGELPDARPGVIPGHEIVGRVVALGDGAGRFAIGDRVGVPWLGTTCGQCRFCRAGRENLCEAARFTGCQLDGGYAEYTVADEAACLPIPDAYTDAEAAPLLCAGLIGLRALRMAGEARRIGLYGFGAAAHIVAQIARHEGREVFAFTRPGDILAQDFARGLGAAWAGGSDALPPVALDAAIIFAPVGALVPAALRALDRGGVVVCAGIHMSDIPQIPYAILWHERMVRSVANLTRADGRDFMAIAPKVPVRTHVETLKLEQANVALERLRRGEVSGALVLVP
jgi:propanol-preferring alcohol dehydrogenase